MPNEALKRRLSGQKDARSKQGTMSRGTNVYRAGTPQARTGGGPNIGRPPSGGGGMGSVNANVGGLAAPPMPSAEPSMSEIVERMTQISPMQLPGAMPESMAAPPAPPGMGGVGGGANPGQEMPGMMGAPNPAAIARRLGVQGART